MSMILMVQAMKTKTGNPSRKLVLMKLADNANDDGVCWPKVEYIADHCEMSERTVQRHLRDLEKQGLIRITERKRSNSVNSSNLYTLTLNGRSEPPTPPENTSNIEDDNLSPYPDTMTPSKENLSPYPDNLTPSEGDSVTPRTSHSFEPVSEPVIEPLVKSDQPAVARKKKNNKKTSLDYSAWPSLPDDQVLADWHILRKTKKAPVTQTVINSIGLELHKAVQAGYTVDQCLTLCCERGWQGFRLSWLQNAASSFSASNRQNTKQAQLQANAEEARRQFYANSSNNGQDDYLEGDQCAGF